MKRHVFWIAALFAVVLAAALVFIIPRSQNFTIVHMQGISSAQNLSHQEWEYFHKREDRPLLMPVRAGDILHLILEVDKVKLEFVTAYSHKDGQDLTFETRDSVLYLGGKPVSLALGSDPSEQIRKWLSTAKNDDLKSLRFLYLENFDTGQMALLQKIARANPGVGLLLGADQVKSVLPLFQPTHLILVEPLTAEAIDILKQQRALQSIWLVLGNTHNEKTGPADLKFLSGFSNLERLTLEANNEMVFPSGQDFLPGNLKSLSLSGFSIENFSFLKRLPNLKELSLKSCEIKDARGLAELGHLTSLDLAECRGITDPSFFNHLPDLRYIGAPPLEDQKALIASLRSLRHLQMLQVSYPQVRDFSGLARLSSLRGLIITGKAEKDVTFQTQSLYGLKQLRYLALENKLVTDPKDWAALEKALPDCRIATVGGVCMGSGWILLLIPVVLAALLIAILRRRQGSSGPGRMLSR